MTVPTENSNALYHRFILFARTATAVAFCVVVLGAYVRLSDAGLGCPDWPGCYGQLLGVPESAEEIERAEQNFPQNRVDTTKAWKEVLHRYLAGILGLLILALATFAVINRRHPQQPLILPPLLLVIVVFQALLGMWTVTLLLKPVIVTAHLLGGFLTLALLWHLAFPKLRAGALPERRRYQYLAYISIGLLIAQITLGGWTASNYAALACTDFPTCQRQWWPPMDFSAAFQPGGEIGTNYEYGVLDGTARTAIHVSHRIGAVVLTLVLGGFLLSVLARRPPRALAFAAGVALMLLILQVLLGVLNVTLSLPLPVATAHNATAALLFLNLTTIARMLKS